MNRVVRCRFPKKWDVWVKPPPHPLACGITGKIRQIWLRRPAGPCSSLPEEPGCPGPSRAGHRSFRTLLIKLVQEEDQRETKIFIPLVVFGLPCLPDVSVFLMSTIQLALAILNPGLGSQSGRGRSWSITRTGDLGRLPPLVMPQLLSLDNGPLGGLKYAKTLRTGPDLWHYLSIVSFVSLHHVKH